MSFLTEFADSVFTNLKSLKCVQRIFVCFSRHFMFCITTNLNVSRSVAASFAPFRLSWAALMLALVALGNSFRVRLLTFREIKFPLTLMNSFWHIQSVASLEFVKEAKWWVPGPTWQSAYHFGADWFSLLHVEPFSRVIWRRSPGSVHLLRFPSPRGSWRSSRTVPASSVLFCFSSATSVLSLRLQSWASYRSPSPALSVETSWWTAAPWAGFGLSSSLSPPTRDAWNSWFASFSDSSFGSSHRGSSRQKECHGHWHILLRIASSRAARRCVSWVRRVSLSRASKVCTSAKLSLESASWRRLQLLQLAPKCILSLVAPAMFPLETSLNLPSFRQRFLACCAAQNTLPTNSSEELFWRLAASFWSAPLRLGVCMAFERVPMMFPTN